MLESIIVAVVTGVAGTIGYVIKARSDRATSRSADWQSFSAEMREWTERRLAERDEAIEELRDEVNELKVEMDRVYARYKAAIRYILKIWNGEQSAPPDEIAGDLPESPWK